MANLLQNLFFIIWCITSSVLMRTKTVHSLRPSNINTVKKKENMRYLRDEDLLTRSSATQHEQFQYLKSGHVFCKGLFHDQTITNILQPEFQDIFRAKELESWLHLARVVCNDMELQLSTIQECKNILEQSSSPEDLPFLQLFHLWQTNKVANSIATSSSLGKIAAELMGVPSVRLYQDSLFVKDPGHGVTDWHFDMNMVPIDTNDYITCWIPLHNIPLNTLDTSSFKGQGLHYATGSHRDVSLHYWYEGSNVDLTNRYAVEDHGAYSVGDCSFHSGWCLHSAPKNSLSIPRYAYTVSYIADGARTLNDQIATRFPDDEDYYSYATWIDKVGWNKQIRSKLLPKVYPTNKDTSTKK